MKFKYKIIISFCIIIFVPIVLAVAVMFSFQHIQVKAIQQTYGMDKDDYSYFSNSMQLLSRFTKEDYQEICRIAQENPAELENQDYLETMNTDLLEKNSYLIVRKDRELIYIGADQAVSLLTQLPGYGEATCDANAGTYIDGDDQALIKQVDFNCSDGSEGSVFIISILKESVPEVKKLVVDGAISIVLILLLTACTLSMWIYTSMLNPIKKLQAAAHNIKEGNLDFTVEADSKDEIGELCRSFEQMRQRLKDNAEEKLAGEKENRALISNIAHDLKTPITAVKGYAEGLLDGVAVTPEKQEKYLKTIYNKANDMDKLINELTTYSGIDSNKIPYHFHVLNIADYFQDCVEEVGLDLEQKDIQLNYTNLAPADTCIVADPEQLKKVINNIISNSVKYMGHDKGIIDIRILDEGESVKIEIEDNGKGIASKDIGNIFERFYRTDSSRNSLQGGSGIGLSIVKKIIEDHGGYVWATSKEGEGTCMHFVIRKYTEKKENEDVIG